MLKVHIERGKHSVIETSGSALELVTDIAVLVNAIHSQFLIASPAMAELIQKGLQLFANEPQIWKPIKGQEGIIFPLPTQED